MRTFGFDLVALVGFAALRMRRRVGPGGGPRYELPEPTGETPLRLLRHMKRPMALPWALLFYFFILAGTMRGRSRAGA